MAKLSPEQLKTNKRTAYERSCSAIRKAQQRMLREGRIFPSHQEGEQFDEWYLRVQAYGELETRYMLEFLNEEPMYNPEDEKKPYAD